jgi:hypothetical protein|tara:strand:+ start:830 stop:976 length:147 start_codon:yes stop_codon:yes gene_type:complete
VKFDDRPEEERRRGSLWEKKQDQAIQSASKIFAVVRNARRILEVVTQD